MELTQEKIKEIRDRSIQAYDKWHRMCRGMGSALENYKDGILYLKIRNSESRSPSNYAVAEDFAKQWIRWNKELSNAKGFVVVFHKIPSGDLINIFSGLF